MWKVAAIFTDTATGERYHHFTDISAQLLATKPPVPLKTKVLKRPAKKDQERKAPQVPLVDSAEEEEVSAARKAKKQKAATPTPPPKEDCTPRPAKKAKHQNLDLCFSKTRITVTKQPPCRSYCTGQLVGQDSGWVLIAQVTESQSQYYQEIVRKVAKAVVEQGLSKAQALELKGNWLVGWRTFGFQG